MLNCNISNVFIINKWLIAKKYYAINIYFYENFRGNSIGVEGIKELAQGLKKLINLNSLTLYLG